MIWGEMVATELLLAIKNTAHGPVVSEERERAYGLTGCVHIYLEDACRLDLANGGGDQARCQEGEGGNFI